MSDQTRNDITKQAVAAAELIKALASDDDQLNHDMVEGETGLFEAVERALDEVRECETQAAGIAAMKKTLTDRETRIKKRMERLRGLIDQAFQMAEIKSHVFPCETVTIKAIPPKLIITDESKIPSRFFDPQPPKLNKVDLAKEAKFEPIEGCELSNGGQTIQIRRA